ncbi:hypothetical protein HOY82DRAFT_127735 [Tuber indicum]|nr:hypothetical protein HOY82DRAFT_127735 [Tuber indicum]
MILRTRVGITDHEPHPAFIAYSITHSPTHKHFGERVSCHRHLHCSCRSVRANGTADLSCCTEWVIVLEDPLAGFNRTWARPPSTAFVALNVISGGGLVPLLPTFFSSLLSLALKVGSSLVIVDIVLKGRAEFLSKSIHLWKLSLSLRVFVCYC